MNLYRDEVDQEAAAKKKKLIIIIAAVAVILLLLVAGAAVWWFFFSTPKSPLQKIEEEFGPDGKVEAFTLAPTDK